MACWVTGLPSGSRYSGGKGFPFDAIASSFPRNNFCGLPPQKALCPNFRGKWLPGVSFCNDWLRKWKAAAQNRNTSPPLWWAQTCKSVMLDLAHGQDLEAPLLNNLYNIIYWSFSYKKPGSLRGPSRTNQMKNRSKNGFWFPVCIQSNQRMLAFLNAATVIFL